MIDRVATPPANQVEKQDVQIRLNPVLPDQELLRVVNTVATNLRKSWQLKSFANAVEDQLLRNDLLLSPEPAPQIRHYTFNPLLPTEFLLVNESIVFGLEEAHQVVHAIAVFLRDHKMEQFNQRLRELSSNEERTKISQDFNHILLTTSVPVLIYDHIQKDADTLLYIVRLLLTPSQKKNLPKIEDTLPSQVVALLEQNPVAAWKEVHHFFNAVEAETITINLRSNLVTTIKLEEYSSIPISLNAIRQFFNFWLENLHDFAMQREVLLDPSLPPFPKLKKFPIQEEESAPFSLVDQEIIDFIKQDIAGWIDAYLRQKQPPEQKEEAAQQQGTGPQSNIRQKKTGAVFDRFGRETTQPTQQSENYRGFDESDSRSKLQQLSDMYLEAGANLRLTSVRLNTMLLPELLFMSMPELPLSLGAIRAIDPVAYYEVQHFFSIELERIFREELSAEDIANLSKPGGFSKILLKVRQILWEHRAPQLEAALGRFQDSYSPWLAEQKQITLEEAKKRIEKIATENDVTRVLSRRTDVLSKKEKAVDDDPKKLQLGKIQRFVALEVDDLEKSALLYSFGIKNKAQQDWLLTTVNIAKQKKIPLEFLTSFTPQQFQAIFGFQVALSEPQMNRLGTILRELSLREESHTLLHPEPNKEAIQKFVEKNQVQPGREPTEEENEQEVLEIRETSLEVTIAQQNSILQTQNRALQATSQVAQAQKNVLVDQNISLLYQASRISAQQAETIKTLEQTLENQVLTYYYENVFQPLQKQVEEQARQTREAIVTQAVQEAEQRAQYLVLSQRREEYLRQVLGQQIFEQQQAAEATAVEATQQEQVTQSIVQTAQPTAQPVQGIVPPVPQQVPSETQTLAQKARGFFQEQLKFEPKEKLEETVGEKGREVAATKLKERIVEVAKNKLGERAGTVVASAIPYIGPVLAAASFLTNLLPKEVRDFIFPAMAAFALKMLSAILSSMSAVGGAIVGVGIGAAFGGFPGALLGGTVGSGLGYIAGQLGMNNLFTGGLGGATTGAGGAGGGFLGNAILTPGAAGSGAVIPLILGGAGVGIVLTSSIIQSQAGTFLPPLPTIGGNGTESQYVEIIKKAEPGIKFDEPADITYTITIQAKPGYTLTLTEVPQDDMKVQLNIKENPQPNGKITIPGNEHNDFNIKLQSLLPVGTVITTDKITLPSYTVPFSSDKSGYNHSNILNTFKLSFTVKDKDGNNVPETATTGESVCFGKCPQAEKGCWPTDGIQVQLPYGDWSHQRAEAIDIANSTPNTKIYSPFSGKACFYKWGSGPDQINTGWSGYGGYGNFILLMSDQNPQDGFIFGHLQSFEPLDINGSKRKPENECVSGIKAGQLLGIMDSTGKSTGPHLHYEYRTTKKQNPGPGDFLLPVEVYGNGIANSASKLPAQYTLQSHVPDQMSATMKPIRTCYGPNATVTK